MAKSTIYDVARLANVSSATVSRYLNQSSYVEREKVKAIEQAIFELNYQPLRRRQGQRSMMLGVIAPNFDSPFVSDVLAGIDAKSSHYNYRMVIETTNWRHDQEIKLLQAFKEQKLDGIIIVVGVVPFALVKTILAATGFQRAKIGWHYHCGGGGSLRVSENYLSRYSGSFCLPRTKFILSRHWQ